MKSRATIISAVLFAALGLNGCGGGDASDTNASDAITVLVDYQNDEFATSHLEYYPKVVKVHPGSTVVFKQAWTGEAHSVTFGKLVDKHMQIIGDYLIDNGNKPIAQDEPPAPELEAALAGMDEDLRYAFDEDPDGVSIAQGPAQPCFLKSGSYPEGGDKPCPKVEQPAFDGSYDIYNSGFIPYEGSKQSNTFTVDFDDDVPLGSYNYYCNIHGPAQYGRVEVVPSDVKVPSKSEVAKAARAEAVEDIEFLGKRLEAAKKTGKTETDEGEVAGNLTGIEGTFPAVHAFVDEFTPKTVRAKAGKPVSWSFVGGHTISFNVPRYFPYFTIDKDGTVGVNPDAFRAVGWPAPPGESGEDEEGTPEGEPPPTDSADVDANGGDDADAEPERDPVAIDAGEWDGRGFRSTGSEYPTGATFTVTFTRKGNYTFACLLHPAMVGKVEVK